MWNNPAEEQRYSGSWTWLVDGFCVRSEVSYELPGLKRWGLGVTKPQCYLQAFRTNLRPGISSLPVLLDFSMTQSMISRLVINRQLPSLIVDARRLNEGKLITASFLYQVAACFRGELHLVWCVLTLWNCQSSLCWNKSLWETWAGRLFEKRALWC